MKIPKFEDECYNKCYCGNDYTYTSKKCLHKLCDSCYNNKFKILGAKFTCPNCQKENETLELCQEDFTKLSLLQNHYDEDLKRRRNINKKIYKRKENFLSIDEYNKYLESVEKCIQRANEKEIENKYSQNKIEKEENYEKREKELEEINKLIKENSPMHYNSSKFYFDFEGNEINPEELIVEQNQIVELRPVKEKIIFIADIDKERKSGGYDINKIYEFLSSYSKAGFIKNRIKN